MNGVLIILVIAAVIALLLFMPISFEYTLSYDGNIKNKILLKFLFYKNDFKDKPKKEKPLKKEKKTKKKKSFSEICEDIKYYKRLFVFIKSDIFKILKYAKDKVVKIKKLDFDVSFAGKDPMQTGILTGVVNGTLYNAVAVVENTVGVDLWDIKVEPDFNREGFVRAEFNCILNTKFAHIIVILIKMSMLFLKYKINKKRI